MISYEVYKIVHLVSIVCLFSGMAGLLAVRMAGLELQPPVKKFVMITHGVGLTFLLISGFGLLARLGMIQNLPGWVYGKLVIWFIMGGILTLVKKKGQIGWPIFILLLAIFTTAAYFAVVKPF